MKQYQIAILSFHFPFNLVNGLSPHPSYTMVNNKYKSTNTMKTKIACKKSLAITLNYIPIASFNLCYPSWENNLEPSQSNIILGDSQYKMYFLYNQRINDNIEDKKQERTDRSEVILCLAFLGHPTMLTHSPGSISARKFV